jgi:hypothetical protein
VKGAKLSPRDELFRSYLLDVIAEQDRARRGLWMPLSGALCPDGPEDHQKDESESWRKLAADLGMGRR